MKLLDEFNVDNVCWESDFPHSDSSWPECARALARRCWTGSSRAIVASLTHENAMRHFQFDPVRDPGPRPVHGPQRCEPKRATSTP